MMRTRIAIAAVAGALASAGCSTWESLSHSEQGTVVGAGVGGLAGNAIAGNALGTLGGAAVGGVIGHEIGRSQDRSEGYWRDGRYYRY